MVGRRMGAAWGLRKARGGWDGPVSQEGSSPCGWVVVPAPSLPPEHCTALDFAHPKGSQASGIPS